MLELKKDNNTRNKSLFEYISYQEYDYDNKSCDFSINSSFFQINEDIQKDSCLSKNEIQNENIRGENEKRMKTLSESSLPLSDPLSFTKENALNIKTFDSSSNLDHISDIINNQLNLTTEPTNISKNDIKIESDKIYNSFSEIQVDSNISSFKRNECLKERSFNNNIVKDFNNSFLYESKNKSKIELKSDNIGKENYNILNSLIDSKRKSNKDFDKSSFDFSSKGFKILFKSYIPKDSDSGQKNEMKNKHIRREKDNKLYSFSESKIKQNIFSYDLKILFKSDISKDSSESSEMNIEKENDNKLNSFSKLNPIQFEILNRRTKRGRKTNLFTKRYSHTALDIDNGISKIQVHFINFIIDLSNDALICEFGKNNMYNFKKPAHYMKKNAKYDYVKYLQSGPIRKVLEMDISPKYLKYDRNYNKRILRDVCDLSEWLHQFFKINYLEFFKDYYYNSKNPLDKITINGKTIKLSKKTKSFYNLILENKGYLKEIARIYLN